VYALDLKQKWKRGDPSPGMWIRLTDPVVAEIVDMLGLDWVAIDSEHVAYDLQTLQILVMLLSNTPTLIRVPGNDPIHIKRILDLGAAGVIVPHVYSAEEARRAIAATKYPPVGVRGTGPRRPGRYGDLEGEYLASANDVTIAAIMVETVGAVEAIDEIVMIPGLDAIMIGAVDLSASMGLLPHFDDPRVTTAIDRVIASAEAARITRISGRAPNPDDPTDVWTMRGLLRQGLNAIPLASDDALIKDGVRASLRAFSSIGGQ
jgi:2-keto-3-deoxy-L-rhamnonate aldolase RhmA